MLCSDGLHGMINDQEIARGSSARGASSLEEATARLVDAANEAGGRDNVTSCVAAALATAALTPAPGGDDRPVSGERSMTLVEREKRVGLHLPVEVRGEDAAGVPLHGVHALRERERRRHPASRATATSRSARGCDLAIELPVSLRHHFGDRDVYRARAVVCRVERFEGEEREPDRGPLPRARRRPEEVV